MASLPPSRIGGLPFVDARGCKDWLGTLPSSVPMAQLHLLEVVRLFNGAEVDPLERLKCQELMREKIAALQGEQRPRLFGKTLPLSSLDEAAWSTGRALLEELESGYRLCLSAARAGASSIADHAPLAAQRLVRTIGAQLIQHAMVYRRPQDGLWQRLREAVALAGRDGALDTRVRDTLESEDGFSTVGEAYLAVRLLRAADLSGMTGAQIEFAEALLRRWIRKVSILPGAAGDDGALDVEPLSRSIRRRIRALQAGEPAGSLGLPDIPSGVEALAQLQRLHRQWCEAAPRSAGRVPAEKEAGVAFGFADAHFYLSGCEPFEQPDRMRELTRQEKDDIAVFGRVSERSQKMRAADFSYELEKWGIVEESLGTWRLLRPANASRPLGLGRLVVLRVGATAPYFLGTIKALAQEAEGAIEICIALFPGKPEPIAVRAADPLGRQASGWTQGFRLPALEKLSIPASLVVPPGMALRGRVIDHWEGGPEEWTVVEVLERGSEFDRVTFR